VWQIEHLRQIKRLIDAGHRPHTVVSLPPVAVLGAPATAIPNSSVAPATRDEFADASIGQALKALVEHDLFGLRRVLERDLVSRGLHGFVTQTVSALTAAVGLAWSRGELRVYHEHVYSSVIQSVLDASRRRVSDEAGSPRILLTTVPGELHTLGLMMAEALFSDMGAQCLLLGAQTPMAEISAAVDAYRIEIVGLSFSDAFPVRGISPFLKVMRESISASVPIWVGGSGLSKVQRLPSGVQGFLKVEDACNALAELQGKHIDV
jgi:methylmalonyl-CoA mutase cobalamin-binding subunit